MIRAILVPLDGSPFGECALPLAMALASRAAATLHLVHVHSTSSPLTPAGMAIRESIDYRLIQDEHSYLLATADRLGEKGLTVKTALLEGDVEAGLKAYAQREAVDLVVLSTHARGAFGRFWLGSVADNLAHDVPVPILLVPAHEPQADVARQAELHSIAVALDGSSRAEKILEPAAELCRLFDAELHLVRVNRPVVLPAYGSDSLVQALEQMHERELREQNEAKNYLEALAANLAGRGVRVGTHVVIEMQPAEGILNEARADNADLIALETHGRRGFSRLFMGSVADVVVHSGTVPVLLQHSGC